MIIDASGIIFSTVFVRIDTAALCDFDAAFIIQIETFVIITNVDSFEDWTDHKLSFRHGALTLVLFSLIFMTGP